MTERDYSMKYIRTKNGIYELVEDNNKEWGKQIVVKFPKNLNMKVADVKDQILKQADTIEELCDYFLIDKNDIEHYEPTTLLIFDDYDDFKYSMFGYEFASGYGCIKTDKGLIYVAKFNWEDEELELIWNQY